MTVLTSCGCTSFNKTRRAENFDNCISGRAGRVGSRERKSKRSSPFRDSRFRYRDTNDKSYGIRFFGRVVRTIGSPRDERIFLLF